MRAGIPIWRKSSARREEVIEVLRKHGLASGPRRIPQACTPPAGLLRQAFAELGSYFCAFGAYMASRPDLLPVGDCMELADCAFRCQPMQPQDFQQAIAQASPRHDALAHCDEAAWQTNPRFEVRQGQLADGTPMLIRIERPDFEQARAQDADLLELLRHPLSRLWSDLDFDSLLQDFEFSLDECGLLQQARSLQGWADSNSSMPERPTAARTIAEFTSSRVLVMEPALAQPLSEFYSESGVARLSGPKRVDVARRVCMAWLGEALLGKPFPARPFSESLALAPSGRLAFLGGLTSQLPQKRAQCLRDYLTAAVLSQPDRACFALLSELPGQPPHSANEALLRRFRQIVPFRDGAWSRKDHSGTLAEEMFVQWRTATQFGHLAQGETVAFYQGLFETAWLAHRLVPERDIFRDAVYEFRATSTMVSLLDMTAFETMADQSRKSLHLLSDLPLKLDLALDRLLAQEDSEEAKSGRFARPKGRSQSAARVIVWLAVLVAVSLLAQKWAAAGGVWQTVGSLMFIVTAGVMMREIIKL